MKKKCDVNGNARKKRMRRLNKKQCYIYKKKNFMNCVKTFIYNKIYEN